MANGGDLFSMSAMRNALQEPIDGDHFTEVTQSSINSFTSVSLTPQETKTQSRSLFTLMTTDSEEGGEDASQFTQTISSLNRLELQRMAFLLTSNSDYFLEIARNKNGSKRLVKLLGISDDLDTFFTVAILRCFLRVMTDKEASYVVVEGLRVFEKQNKERMYQKILKHAIDLARDKYGHTALNRIITDMNNAHYRRRQLFDQVALKALFLSNDAYGNFVVQHVLKQYDSRCTPKIASNLRGHFVELSFNKYGSYIVERLLDTEKIVVTELSECEKNRLVNLENNEYGNFVVVKALKVAKEMYGSDLY